MKLLIAVASILPFLSLCLGKGVLIGETEEFVQTYRSVIDNGDAVFSVLTGGTAIPSLGGTGDVTGSSFILSGGVYRPDDVKIRSRQGPGNKKFAGGLQPTKFPARRTNFFWHGECTATQSRTSDIDGHSCLLNLCLGGGGNNCVSGYAGGTYKFDPTDADQVDGEPGLAPTFEGQIIGGTGAFEGVTGIFEVKTLTGRTTPNDPPQFGLITQDITFITNIPLPAAPGPILDISSLSQTSNVESF
jgi:hypothetical protein